MNRPMPTPPNDDAPTAPADDPSTHAPADAPRTRGERGARGARGQRGGGRNSAAPRGPNAAQPARTAPGGAPRPEARKASPTLEQLATLYPRLFGAQFLPLKRGIYEDLLAAQAGAIEPDALKEALQQHTRSTRYLVEVAAGRPRHDLDGRPVEPMAPEHVHHALIEVFRRRARRGPQEDARPRLVARIAQAIENSGLSPSAYDALVRGRDAEANAALDEAVAEAGARAARAEALLRAFEGSGQSVEAFADMYGMELREATRQLDRARRSRTA